MIKPKIYVKKIITYMTFIRVYNDIFVYTLKTVIYVIKTSTCFDVNKHLLEGKQLFTNNKKYLLKVNDYLPHVNK